MGGIEPQKEALPEVEVVIAYWKRPDNILPILNAFRNQTIPCQITVFDASPEGFELPAEALPLIDTLYRCNRNRGAFNRFIPAFGYELTYTYFHDDDMLPGSRVLEHFVRHARQCDNEFAVLGQIGRILVESTVYDGALNPGREPERLLAVDSIIRGYFVKTDRLLHMLQFKQKMGLQRIGNFDDLLLSTSIQFYTGFPSYLTPKDSPDPEEKINKEELPEPFAVWQTPQHFPQRNDYLMRAFVAGWRSLATPAKPAI